MSRVRKVNVPGLTRLPAFCHATIVDDQVFVAGVVGADPATDELVGGGAAMVEMDCIAFLPAGSQDAHEVSAH